MIHAGMADVTSVLAHNDIQRTGFRLDKLGNVPAHAARWKVVWHTGAAAQALCVNDGEDPGQATEIAVAIGTEPYPLFVRQHPCLWVSEVDIVGGIRGEPVELVSCETVTLPSRHC